MLGLVVIEKRGKNGNGKKIKQHDRAEDRTRDLLGLTSIAGNVNET